MRMVYWEIPLKREWNTKYLCAARIPIVQRCNGRLVLTTAGDQPHDLRNARNIVKLHNSHVKAQLETQKAKHVKNETPAHQRILRELPARGFGTPTS